MKGSFDGPRRPPVRALLGQPVRGFRLDLFFSLFSVGTSFPSSDYWGMSFSMHFRYILSRTLFKSSPTLRLFLFFPQKDGALLSLGDCRVSNVGTNVVQISVEREMVAV